jgi:hypothetical protein
MRSVDDAATPDLPSLGLRFPTLLLPAPVQGKAHAFTAEVKYEQMPWIS